MSTGLRCLTAAICALISFAPLTARTYYVRTSGNDSSSGFSPDSAFRTIQKGANSAMPGDTVLVYSGIYRERVKPPRGGTGENARITYKARPGDTVAVTGLDLWTPTWTADGELHRATPATSMFTDNAYVDGANPYRIRHSRNRSWCLGQVVVDGVEYVEQTSKALANAAEARWWADQTTGTIYINFPSGGPTGRKVEITTRRGVFRPYLLGLGYITVDGFILQYCANQTIDGFYSPNNDDNHQSGLVGTRRGHHWIIRNCVIRKAKTIALTVGMGGFFQEPYFNFMSGPTRLAVGPHTNYDNETPKQTNPDIRKVGYNQIYNNVFDSCGQAGIVGLGHFGNIIYGNRFSNIPSMNNNRSWEDGAIKFHMSLGSIIECNLFEGYPHGAWSVWLDAFAIGSRITRNVFRGHPQTKFSAIYVEISSARDYVMNTIDNNLFLDCNSGIGGARSDGVGIYHNLFYGGDFAFSMGSEREGCGNTDRCGCGATRIFALNNLLIDNDANYGLAFRPKETKVNSDYNILIPGGRNFQLANQGTANAAWCGGQEYTSAQIDAYHTSIGSPGSYWKGTDTTWLVADSFGPVGCVGDLPAWRAMMDSIDGHTVERSKDAFTNSARSIAIDLTQDPGIGGPRLPGIGLDFNGNPIGASPKAGPFQDLGMSARTYAFWKDNAPPGLPNPPAPPSGFTVRNISGSVNRLSWTDLPANALDIVVERRSGGGEWEVWGYVNPALDSLDDDQLTNAASYTYRISTRNSGGLSSPAMPVRELRRDGMRRKSSRRSVVVPVRAQGRTMLRVLGSGVEDVSILSIDGSRLSRFVRGSDGGYAADGRLPPGVYFSRIRSAEGETFRRFLVK